VETRAELAAGEYRLVVSPARGGSILAFEWQGQPLLREAAGSGILDVACFALVPFSNRIAGGRFDWLGRATALTPNFPEVDPRNPLHGFGWLSEWTILSVASDAIRLGHTYPRGDWPWGYRAELDYALGGQGLTARLALTNLAATAMPAGLGFHPYFPRNAATRYLGLHRGEWRNGADGLPAALDDRTAAIDWWAGAPVGTRQVDTVYSGREGALQVCWPDRALSLQIDCSDNLSMTSVFAPRDADWFCVEPVSHMTDALNHPDGAMAILQPGETMSAELRMEASALPGG